MGILSDICYRSVVLGYGYNYALHRVIMRSLDQFSSETVLRNGQRIITACQSTFKQHQESISMENLE